MSGNSDQTNKKHTLASLIENDGETNRGDSLNSGKDSKTSTIEISGEMLTNFGGKVDLYLNGLIESDMMIRDIRISNVKMNDNYGVKNDTVQSIDNTKEFINKSIQIAGTDCLRGIVTLTGEYARIDTLYAEVTTTVFKHEVKKHDDGYVDERGKFFVKVDGFVKGNVITDIKGEQRVMTEQEEIAVYGIAGTVGIDADEMMEISKNMDSTIVLAAACAATTAGMNKQDRAREKGIGVTNEVAETVTDTKGEGVTKPTKFISTGQNKLEKYISKKEAKVTDETISDAVSKITKVRKKTTSNVKGFFKNIRDKKVSGVELYLPNSNIKLRFHSIDTTLKRTNLFYKMRSADNIAEDVDVILDILDHTTGLFADSHNISNEELLDRIHDADIQYLYWGSFMATVGRKTTDLKAPCIFDGSPVQSKEVKLMDVYKESLTEDALKGYDAYDPSKTIDELQTTAAVGASYVFAKELDDIIINITGEVPSVIRRLRLSPYIRQYIVDECSDILAESPVEVQSRMMTISNKLEYIHEFDPYRVELITKTKLEPVISLSKIEIMDKETSEVLDIDMSKLGGEVNLGMVFDTVAEIDEGLLVEFVDFMDEKYEMKSNRLSIEGRCNNKDHVNIAIKQGVDPKEAHMSVGMIEPKMYLFILLQRRISRG